HRTPYGGVSRYLELFTARRSLVRVRPRARARKHGRSAAASKQPWFLCQQPTRGRRQVIPNGNRAVGTQFGFSYESHAAICCIPCDNGNNAFENERGHWNFRAELSAELRKGSDIRRKP